MATIKEKVKDWYCDHEEEVTNAVIGGVCACIGYIVGYGVACVKVLYSNPDELYNIIVEAQAELKKI